MDIRGFEQLPALWFDKQGCGPSHFVLKVHHFPADKEGKIPATIGLRVDVDRSPGSINFGPDIAGGGFMMHRDQVLLLHEQLGHWLGETSHG